MCVWEERRESVRAKNPTSPPAFFSLSLFLSRLLTFRMSSASSSPE